MEYKIIDVYLQLAKANPMFLQMFFQALYLLLDNAASGNAQTAKTKTRAATANVLQCPDSFISSSCFFNTSTDVSTCFFRKFFLAIGVLPCLSTASGKGQIFLLLPLCQPINISEHVNLVHMNNVKFAGT